MTPLKITKRRHFAWRFFVISSFCVVSFRYFVFSRGVAWRFFVISLFRVALFRLFAWRYFVILRGVISWQKDEKTKWLKSATIVISLFRLYAWRYFVISLFCVALFRGKKTKRRNGTNQPPYKTQIPIVIARLL